MGTSDRGRIESFEDLIVWQKAVDVADLVLEMCDAPSLCTRFWLCDQLGRASTSISANVAEGHDGGSRRVFLKHLYIARGSSAETLTFLRIIRRRNYSTADVLGKIGSLLNEVRKMLNALINKIEKQPTEPDNPRDS
jgi:four helix bundle protein